MITLDKKKQSKKEEIINKNKIISHNVFGWSLKEINPVRRYFKHI